MNDVRVLKVESRPAIGELKKHIAEKGKRYVFVDKDNFAKAKMYVIARVVSNIAKPYQSAGLRKHSVDAVMLFLGRSEGLRGLTVEAEIDGKVHRLKSPAGVYVPAGTMHTYRIMKGSGTYIKVVLAPGGDYNAVTS